MRRRLLLSVALSVLVVGAPDLSPPGMGPESARGGHAHAGPYLVCGACSPTPKADCFQPSAAKKGRFDLRDRSPDERDRLVWKWPRGAEGSFGLFPGPDPDFDDYVLCVYDASADAQPRLEGRMPAGGDCPGGPCWTTSVGTGTNFRYVYKDRDLDPSGIALLRAQRFNSARTKVFVKGEGENLDMPPLPLTPPVRVQLQAAHVGDFAGTCWEARYDEFIARNETDRFKANPDGPTTTTTTPTTTTTTLPVAGVTEIIDASGDGGGNILSWANDVAVDGAGNVYVVGQLSDNAFRIAPGGVVTEIIDASGDGAGNILNHPSSVAVDAAGNVYVSGHFSDNAFRITPGGTITEIIDENGDGAGGYLFEPNGIAVDPAGNVYVTGGDSDNVFRITSGGVITEFVSFLAHPYGVATDGAGNVYVTSIFDRTVVRIAPGGTTTVLLDGGLDCTISLYGDALRLTTDGAGNVYVPGNGGSNAYQITPAGVITEIIDTSGDGAGNTLVVSEGVATDGAGTVYVTGRQSHNAFRIEPGGVITEIIDGTGDGAGSILTRASAIAVDSAGNAYVAGRDSNNVFKIESMSSPAHAFLDELGTLLD